MPLPSAPASLSLGQIQTEFGGSNPISLSEYYKGGSFVTTSDTAPNVPTSGQISMSNFRGAAKVSAPPSVEYLVVAGGGGGGAGGGADAIGTGDNQTQLASAHGGGGGFKTATGLSVTVGAAVTVTVGGGGHYGGLPYGTGQGGNGGGSAYGPISTSGGGGGGAAYGVNHPGLSEGINGGSGGGGGSSCQTFLHNCWAQNGGKGLGTAGEGANGTVGGWGWEPWLGHCGGGSGMGGGGQTSPISGSSLHYSSGHSADGANRGAGGHGAHEYSNGGSGYSGVVIIRYSNTYANAASTTGSPTFTNTGGHKIYKFTGSGSITF